MSDKLARANEEALTKWRLTRYYADNPTRCEPRPKLRPDLFPTRNCVEWWTEAEMKINDAIFAIEQDGASQAITDALILLAKARDRVADHVEGNGL